MFFVSATGASIPFFVDFLTTHFVMLLSCTNKHNYCCSKDFSMILHTIISWLCNEAAKIKLNASFLYGFVYDMAQSCRCLQSDCTGVGYLADRRRRHWTQVQELMLMACGHFCCCCYAKGKKAVAAGVYIHKPKDLSMPTKAYRSLTYCFELSGQHVVLGCTRMV